MNDSNLDDRLKRRLCTLWRRQIEAKAPHDNGDAMHNAMAKLLHSKIAPATTEQLDKFEAALLDTISAPSPYGCYTGSDYGPGRNLAEACEESDLNAVLVPIKSSVSAQEGYVISRFGYSGKSMSHVPLDDGGWLITSLSGPISVLRRLADVNDAHPELFTKEPA